MNPDEEANSEADAVEPKLDAELCAMISIVEELEPLPPEARYRVIRWATDRFGG